MIKKIKVLIVDDHAIMREGIRAILGTYPDFEVVGEASDGGEAITKVKEFKPDIIVMDIAMPKMDGIEATRRILKINPKIKILALSQHSDREYVLSTIKAGAISYISKRGLGEELAMAIRGAFQGNSFLHPTAASTLIQDYRKSSVVDSYDELTSRERVILKLVAEGHTSREIADMLSINIKTVQGHRTKLMEKLDLHNKTELIKYALKKGIIVI